MPLPVLLYYPPPRERLLFSSPALQLLTHLGPPPPSIKSICSTNTTTYHMRTDWSLPEIGGVGGGSHHANPLIPATLTAGTFGVHPPLGLRTRTLPGLNLNKYLTLPHRPQPEKTAVAHRGGGGGSYVWYLNTSALALNPRNNQRLQVRTTTSSAPRPTCQTTRRPAWPSASSAPRTRAVR